jgi:hypothetical protein
MVCPAVTKPTSFAGAFGEGVVGRPRGMAIATSFRMMLRFIHPARLLRKLPAALVAGLEKYSGK